MSRAFVVSSGFFNSLARLCLKARRAIFYIALPAQRENAQDMGGAE
jgi:hypothetical protein